MSDERDREIAIFTSLWRYATETWGGALLSAAVIMALVAVFTVPLGLYMRAHGRVAHLPVPRGTLTIRCVGKPDSSCSVSLSPP